MPELRPSPIQIEFGLLKFYRESLKIIRSTSETKRVAYNGETNQTFAKISLV